MFKLEKHNFKPFSNHVWLSSPTMHGEELRYITESSFAHLYGTPRKFDELNAVIKKHNAILVEDAAESLGAMYKGKQAGTLGKYNTISFNVNKIITDFSGGCFLTNDLEAANKARKRSTQARENEAGYQHEELGYEYRMSNVIAGVIRGSLHDELNWTT